MNTFDPTEDIVYCHLPREVGKKAISTGRNPVACRLPWGYANKSPRTRITPAGDCRR